MKLSIPSDLLHRAEKTAAHAAIAAVGVQASAVASNPSDAVIKAAVIGVAASVVSAVWNTVTSSLSASKAAKLDLLAKAIDAAVEARLPKSVEAVVQEAKTSVTVTPVPANGVLPV